MTILPFAVFVLCVLDWGLAGLSRTLLITISVIAIMAATIVRRLSTGLWVSLYAWAMRVPSSSPHSWKFPLAILWTELTPSQYLRRWRAMMGWSSPVQEHDDSLALRAAHDFGSGPEAPLLLVARIAGENDFTRLLRRYNDALLRVFGTANVGPTFLKRNRMLYLAIPFVMGLAFLFVAATGPATSSSMLLVVAISLIAISILLFVLQLSAYELSRFHMVEILMDASLSPKIARERLEMLGFAAFKE